MSESSSSDDKLCLDVKQHIVGYLGLDYARVILETKLVGEAREKPKKPSRLEPCEPSEAQRNFPMISSRDVSSRPEVKHDLLSVQLLSKSWYAAFHSAVLEADHIIVYRALSMRKRIIRLGAEGVQFNNRMKEWSNSEGTSGKEGADGIKDSCPKKPATAGGTKTGASASKRPGSASTTTSKAKSGGTAAKSVSKVAASPGAGPPKLPKSLQPSTATHLLHQIVPVATDFKDVLERSSHWRDALEDEQNNKGDRVAHETHEVILEFLKEARVQMDTLHKSALLEVTAMKQPPARVIEAMGLVVALLPGGKGRTLWSDLCPIIKSPSFLSKVLEAGEVALTDPAASVHLEKVVTKFFGAGGGGEDGDEAPRPAPPFTVDDVKRCSIAATVFYQWFLSLVEAHDEVKKIRATVPDDDDGVQLAGDVKDPAKAALAKSTRRMEKEKKIWAHYSSLKTLHQELAALHESGSSASFCVFGPPGFGRIEGLLGPVSLMEHGVEAPIRSRIEAQALWDLQKILAEAKQGAASPTPVGPKPAARKSVSAVRGTPSSVGVKKK